MTTSSALSPPAAGLRLRRCPWLTGLARFVAGGLLSYHRLEVSGAERLPRCGAALLLPKHRYYRDILVEGVVLHRATGRYASYVMKVGLSGALEWMGGVKIVRPKDIRQLRDRDERRRRIAWAREKNRQTLDYLAGLYRAGELVVSHPEGRRCPDAMGPLQGEILEHLRLVEQESGLRVPLIPIGLHYERVNAPRSAVHIRVGEALYADAFADLGALQQAVGERIAELSGMADGGRRGAGAPGRGQTDDEPTPSWRPV